MAEGDLQQQVKDLSIAGELYISEKTGNDSTGNGTKEKPYKSVLAAMLAYGKEPFPSIFVDSKSDDKKYEPIAKAQLKKQSKIFAAEQRKKQVHNVKEQEDAERREKNLEEAKKITISQDESLPTAQKIKIFEGEKCREKRVKVSGWVHRLRRQGLFNDC